MRGASNPDGRTAAPGLLRFANKKQTAISLISFIFPFCVSGPRHAAFAIGCRVASKPSLAI